MTDYYLESDASSMDEVKESMSPDEQNRILKAEIDSLKLQVKRLNETNEQLRRNSVSIQVKAEQEEEYISNTLLKKITELKKEKESLAINFEQEEECLTNELNRKFTQLRQEKVALERTLAKEQEDQVCKLKSRIEKLETDMRNKQECLDRLRREKIELENALEQEQEALVNRLWKKMEKLETEKRTLQEKLECLGAALLSGSSSTHSLASQQGLAVACDNGGAAGGGSAGAPGTTLLLEPCAPTASGNSRPGSRSSGGPNSLRNSGSGRPAQTRSSPLTPGSTMPTSSGAATAISSQPGSGPALLAGTDARQYNQSSAASAVAVAPGSVAEPRPPHSPMDTDTLMQDRTFYTSAAGAASGGTVRAHSPTHQPIGEDGQEKKDTDKAGSPTPSRPPQLPLPMQDQELNGPIVSYSYVNRLRSEVAHLRELLAQHEAESATRMSAFESEERSVAEENRKLRQQLAAEKERREALSRQLSESESSLEMEDERFFNEACRSARLRTISDSSTPPFHLLPASSNVSAPHSLTPAFYGPGHAYAAAVAAALAGGGSHVGASVTSAAAASRHCCRECGQRLPSGLEEHQHHYHQHHLQQAYSHSHTPQQQFSLHGHAYSHPARPVSTCFTQQQQQQQAWLPHSITTCVRTGSAGCPCTGGGRGHSPPSNPTVGAGRPAPPSGSPSTPTTSSGLSAGVAGHDNEAAGPTLHSFARPSGQVAGNSAGGPQKRLSSQLSTGLGFVGSIFSEAMGSGAVAGHCRGGGGGGGRFLGDEVTFDVNRNGDGCHGDGDQDEDEDEESRCATPPLCPADSARQ